MGSCFAGIGGFELGLELAGHGPTLWQIEHDPFCCRVLEKHWPGVTRYGDIRQVDPTWLVRPGIICGGFPCQDISSARSVGARAALAGRSSGLWGELARIIAAVRSPWVAIENSGNQAVAWVDHVVRDLGKLGYECLPCPVSAWAVGAKHDRDRVFVVGHNRTAPRPDVDAEGKFALPFDAKVAGSPRSIPNAFGWGFEPELVRAIPRLSGRLDTNEMRRNRALGNAVVPQAAAVVGHVINELRGVAA